MGGIFDLADPKDLLAKLGRELDRLRADPDDVDHAFNFLYYCRTHVGLAISRKCGGFAAQAPSIKRTYTRHGVSLGVWSEAL